MNLVGIKLVLSELTGKHLYASCEADNTNIYISCPLAPFTHPSGRDSSRSFSIRVQLTNSSCGYCWACKWSGTILQLAKDYESYSGEDLSSLKDTIRILEIPDLEYICQEISTYDEVPEMGVSESLVYYNNALPLDEGLFPRLSKEEIERWGVRYDKMENRALFPVYSEGKFRGMQGRQLSSSLPKYSNYFKFQKSRYLFGCHIDIQDSVIVVEGPIDAIKVHSATGLHTVALFGSSTGKYQLRSLMEDYSDITLMLDNDPAGWVGTTNLVTSLWKTHEVRIVNYQGLPAKDPGSMTGEQLLRVIENARVVLPTQ